MGKREDALEYHSRGRKGKIQVTPTKPCLTKHDLSLAYTPGVAEPVRDIAKDPGAAYEYTAKGNLVAVVSNGTAILGLGDLGPLASKPVMEGKGVLFKRFADIDVFDIELNTKDPDEIIRTVKILEPTFGGINLEDIKAPECFYIEEELKKICNIPVFHDDQHGTAIISGAALLNALEITRKDIKKIRVVCNGAGAAGISCINLYISLGVNPDNILMCDTTGVIYKGRTKGMNKYKEIFARDTPLRTLAEAMVGADVFLGVSVKGALTQDMVKSMAKDPIIFAMANPDPEIGYDEAKAVRPDVLMATGRSDYPNQVNNVLGFPFIFRGALDVRATAITENMKLAACRALARLAKEDVPDAVLRAYTGETIRFGREYIIPKPFDPRVLLWVAPAVAEAAIKDSVARKPFTDISSYRDELEARLGRSRAIIRGLIHRAKKTAKRIVFPEGESDKILRACQIIREEKIAEPILIGREEVILRKIKEMNLDLGDTRIIDRANFGRFEDYVDELHRLRMRKGMTRDEACRWMTRPNRLGALMVHMGDADGMISGYSAHYPDALRPALQIIGRKPDVGVVAGLYLLTINNNMFIFADTTVNIDPTAEQLAEIALHAASAARRFNMDPRVALLSFSNFGSVDHPQAAKVRKAVEILAQKAPDLMADGEMQADTAISQEILAGTYPFSKLKKVANVLVFPDLNAGNICYKLVTRLGGGEAIGPILMGMQKPVHVLQRGCEVSDIVNMTTICVVDAIDAEQEANAKLVRIGGRA